MSLSRYLMHRIHQTRVSAALKKLPPAAYLAGAWWKRTQSDYFKNVCSTVCPPASVAQQNDLPSVTIPSLHDVVAKLPEFVSEGEEFSRRMAEFCSTTKFQSYSSAPGSLGYQDIYAQILKHIVGRPNVRILEIGIGVNDPTAKSGMSRAHRPGASLNGWCGYFPGADVHGADVDRRCLIDTDKYKTHFADQLNPQTLLALADQLGGDFDLIVDDGLHTPEANANVIATLLPRIKPSGIMVIEDILPTFDFLWVEAQKYLQDSYRLDFFPSSVLRQHREPGGEAGIAVISRNEHLSR